MKQQEKDFPIIRQYQNKFLSSQKPLLFQAKVPDKMSDEQKRENQIQSKYIEIYSRINVTPEIRATDIQFRKKYQLQKCHLEQKIKVKLWKKLMQEELQETARKIKEKQTSNPQFFQNFLSDCINREMNQFDSKQQIKDEQMQVKQEFDY